MQTVTVQVTAEDIREGVAGSCLACPLARAVHRATGNDRIIVGPTRVGVLDNAAKNGWEWFVPSPYGFALFMGQFDHNATVWPRVWDLELPDEAFAAEE